MSNNKIDSINNLRNTPEMRLYLYAYGSRTQEVLGTALKIPETFEDELTLTYEEYVVYLLNKYGKAKCDYFHSDSCQTKNTKIERLDEGLFCHHIAEECNVSLRELTYDEYAREKPFDLYDAKNFVYCNFFEHLLLHLKAVQEDVRVGGDKSFVVDMSGVKMICRELNRFYATGKILPLHKVAGEIVRDKYDRYLSIVKFIINDVELSKYCDAEDMSTDANGVVMKKIFDDLNREKKE